MSTYYITPELSTQAYPNKDYDSLATMYASLQDAAAETPARDAGIFACLSHVSSDGGDNKSGLERSTIKMTSGSFATRASA
jgi:hypothetical protein